MVFDLGDSARWEYMLPSNDKPSLLVPNLAANNDEEKYEEVLIYLFLISVFIYSFY